MVARIFNCRLLAEIELTLNLACLIAAGEGGKGVGGRDMHTVDIGIHPLDDGVGAEKRGIARCAMLTIRDDLPLKRIMAPAASGDRRPICCVHHAEHA